jgi:hypothetical protein
MGLATAIPPTVLFLRVYVVDRENEKGRERETGQGERGEGGEGSGDHVFTFFPPP